MTKICITEIDEMHDVEVEMNNRYELEAIANAILPIVKTVNDDEVSTLKMRVHVYEKIDLLDFSQSVFMKIYHAIMQVCQDKKDLLGRYTQELKTKLEADPRFSA